MLTLYTLPVCPRCDLIKKKLEAANIEYVEGTDAAKIEEFSDKFWPIGVDDGGRVYEFPDLLLYIQSAPERPNPTISQISLPHQITMEELL